MLWSQHRRAVFERDYATEHATLREAQRTARNKGRPSTKPCFCTVFNHTPVAGPLYADAFQDCVTYSILSCVLLSCKMGLILKWKVSVQGLLLK